LGSPELRLLDEAGCPDRTLLDADDLVAVFGGDGTINSVVQALTGWDGAVLILPGGTMNLASKRMHGDASAHEILQSVACGQARRARPKIICTPHGNSLAGVMVGPGTSWGDVREALRDADLRRVAASTVRAFVTTTAAARIVCTEPALGRADGYPMVEALPNAAGMELSGYHADDVGEFAVGLIALLRHDFRSGPHDSFQIGDRVTLSALDGEPVGTLIDGETAPSAANVVLTVGTAEVDLLVTAGDD
jgi:Diacylglycerol kinase catalytic domain